MKMNYKSLGIILFTISFGLSTISYSQETKDVNNSAKPINIKTPNSTQGIGDSIAIKNSAGNSIITITDEGNNAGSITIPQSTPSSTTNKLYNEGGTLKFNGDLIGGGAIELNDLTDAKYDGYSLFLGNDAGSNDDGSFNYNTAFGKEALKSNSTGRDNTAIGYQALNFNSTGDYNTATGNLTLFRNTTGNSNTAIGYHALYSNTTAGYNTATGTYALRSNTTGNSNTASGYSALGSNTTGNSNTASGNFALYLNTTGIQNTATGTSALKFNTTGSNNTAIGRYALFSNTTGSNNTATGSSALYLNAIGNNNTCIGYLTNFYNEDGSNNTIIGTEAGAGSSAHSKSGNIFIGYQAGYDETESDKLYIENSNSSSPLIYGDFVSDKIGINGKLGVGTTNPSDVVHIVGTTGQNGLRIQVGSATKFRTFSNGGTAIGQNNFGGTPTDGLYVHGDINYNGALTSVSDKRYKKNIKPLGNSLENISKLRGVTYDWRREEFPERDFTNKKQIGVIAQEVEAVFPELVSTNKDGYKSVDYSKLTAILIESVKELEKQNEELRKQNSKFIERFIDLEKKINNPKFVKHN